MVANAPLEQHGNEAPVRASGVVEVLANEAALPADATPHGRCFVILDAAAIGLGADHQHPVGVADVFLHPERPALFGEGLVLVQDGVDPVLAELVGELEDAVGMLVRVVTIANEHPWRVRHRADLLHRSLVRNPPLHYLGSLLGTGEIVR